MQTASLEDNLHELSKYYFLEKVRKYFKMLSAKILTLLAKHFKVDAISHYDHICNGQMLSFP